MPCPAFPRAQPLFQERKVSFPLAVRDFGLALITGVGKRCLYLLFNRKWAEEDLNDNGVGLRLLNEEIDGARFKDIAF